MRIKINPLDAKFSKLVRLMHPVCEVCGRNRATQIHHFKGRRYQSVRYSLENCIAVDFSCHRKFHESPEWAVEFMKKRLGVRYDSFVFRANTITKRYKPDKKLLNIWLNQELKKYDGCEHGVIKQWLK